MTAVSSQVVGYLDTCFPGIPLNNLNCTETYQKLDQHLS